MAVNARSKTRIDRRAFGDALATAMRCRGMTQSALAARLDGMAQSAVSAWVNGDAAPNYEIVFRVEAILGLTPGHLSQHLGYVPIDGRPTASVEEAICGDPLLGDVQRQALVALYREFTVGQSRRG